MSKACPPLTLMASGLRNSTERKDWVKYLEQTMSKSQWLNWDCSLTLGTRAPCPRLLCWIPHSQAWGQGWWPHRRKAKSAIKLKAREAGKELA